MATVADITFANCTRSGVVVEGGGAVWANATSRLSLLRVRFFANTVVSAEEADQIGGGAVACMGGCDFVDCRFEGNAVLYSPSVHSVFGGAVLATFRQSDDVSFVGKFFFVNLFISI